MEVRRDRRSSGSVQSAHRGRHETDTTPLAAGGDQQSRRRLMQMRQVIGSHRHAPEPAMVNPDLTEHRKEPAEGPFEMRPVVHRARGSHRPAPPEHQPTVGLRR